MNVCESVLGSSDRQRQLTCGAKGAAGLQADRVCVCPACLTCTDTQQGLTGSHYLLLSTGGGWRWQRWEPGTRFIVFDEKAWGSGEDDYGGRRGERSAQRTLIGRDGSPL